MCRKVTCRRCGKASWAGCGAHVEQVLSGVPKSERCTCASGATAAPASSGAPKKGLLARMMGR